VSTDYLRPITREQFEEKVSCSALSKYWGGRSIDVRWPYISRTAELVDIVRPHTVLELGNAGLSVVPGCDTLDNAPRFKPTYLTDATVVPWPIEDKAYDLFIGHQVMEHMSGRQREVFDEIRRIAHHAAISLPYKWPMSTKNKGHGGITRSVIDQWTRYDRPKEVMIFGPDTGRKRIWLHYEF
jgi:hypothetical protein